MEIRKLIITRGLPASGKSTYAKELVLNNQKIKRINRDDLRYMLNGYVLTWDNQAIVVNAEKKLIETILLSGYDVISDNMYIRSDEMETLIKFVKEFESQHPTINVIIEIENFMNTPIETCIERDSKREKPTTGEVIKKLHQIYVDQNETFMKHYNEYYEQTRQSKT